MPPSETAESAAAPPHKATGSLKAATGSLGPDGAQPAARLAATPAPRDLSLRIGELIIFLAAILGAMAVGLGLSDYLAAQPYVSVYLIAYAAFRVADLLVREDAMLGADRPHLARRIMAALPVLALFAAAPFERTYLYGGSAPRWLSALGLLIELMGLWLALGARIQLGYFSTAEADEAPRPIVHSGLYRHIRHPTYAGEFLVLFAWPFEYAAPLTAILMVVVGIFVLRRRIGEEEAALLASYGDEYAAYMRTTDGVIPNVW
ncbi:MAG TPA: isoprenylcysteine carboxylmethyltransferase family protein [Candidatus Binataceae bacterium]|nr:isoprenylcysteine carboxylmethyltransferase family protein [Candidatus Binataceae bacterium]